jgi:hypothetical protein
LKTYQAGKWIVLVCSTVVALALSAIPGSPLTRSAFAGPKEDSGHCSVAGLRGIYVASVNGFTTNQPPPQFTVSAFAPVMLLGTFTFDGAGSVSRSVTVNVAGLPFPIADTGTYLVSSDCSGSIAFPTHSDTLNFNIVDSDSIAIVATTPGESGAGTLTKQDIEDCSAGSFHGIYVFNQNGLGTFQNPPQLIDGFFPVSVVGTWTFDGKGGVTRSLSLVFGGFPNPYSDVGSYQVNSDCTVSAYFPSDDEPFKLIAVDARRLIEGVVTVGRMGAGILVKQRL